MLKAVSAGATLLLVLTGYVLWKTGITTSVGSHFDGHCYADDSIPAAEDIVIDPTTGVAYISSYRADTAGIYTLDLNRPDATTAPLTLDTPQHFLPLGIAGFPVSGPFSHLFVVNRHAAPSVEVFALPSGEHLRTIRHPLIRFPNNVVAVAPQEIYITNTHATDPDSPWRWIATLLRLETGSVIRVKDASVTVAAEDIGYANGITVTPAYDEVFVGSVATHEVHVFKRREDGVLNRVNRMAAPGGVDNLALDGQGRLYAAVHPQAFAALAHLSGRAPFAPSRVVRFEKEQAEIVFEDPGQSLAAAAIGSVWGNHLLIGPVRDDHFLRCRF